MKNSFIALLLTLILTSWTVGAAWFIARYIQTFEVKVEMDDL